LDNIEIQIIDADNSILGTLTVAESDKFPLSLNKSIANLKNINERSGSFSTSFKIASTKENDILLEHLYYASEKNYKDWDADKRARIIVNGIDIDTGRLRVDRVSAKDNDRDYNFTFFGDNMDWVLLMQDKYFNDLPYLNQTISWDSTVTENSWSNTAGNDSPVFSLINRGERLKPNMVSVSDLYPDYFAYDIVKDAFKLIGYNLSSSFIEQDKFKKLITPFFGNNFKASEEDIEAERAFVRLDTNVLNYDTSVTNTVTGTFAQQIYNSYLDSSYSTPMSGYSYSGSDTGTLVAGYDETPPYFDNNSNFTNFYTAPQNGYYNFTLDVSASLTCAGPSPRVLRYWLYKESGGTPTLISLLNSDGTGWNVSTSGGISKGVISGVFETPADYYLDAGDKLYLRCESGFDGIYIGSYPVSLTHYNNTTFDIQLTERLVAGNSFNWQTVSDNEVSLLKYITDIGKLFNWYFRTDTATRTVYIESRDDFYKALTTAENWTDKIDDNKQHELYFNSKYYTQLHKFSYAEDSDDEFIEWYNDRLGFEFQNLTHEYPEKFKTGTTTLQLDVIAPTISRGDYWTGGNTPIVSFLWDAKPEDTIPEVRLNYKPRLLYYNYSTQQDIDGVTKEWRWNDEVTNRTTIPYALSFKRVVNNVLLADVESNLDFKDLISFYSTGALLDTSITDNGLYTQYYQKTTREILEGKRLHINLFIDLVDYKNIDLRQPIYFDNRYADIEGYWKIEKISNFKAIGTQSTKFELIQAKNFVRLPYKSLTGNPFTDFTEGETTMRKANTTDNSTSRGETMVIGTNNSVVPDTTTVGDNLTNTFNSNVRMGVYNDEVSSDLFQLGVGTSNESYSLIRADRFGNIIFNGKIIRGSSFDSTIVQTKTTNFTLNKLTDTYLVDTSSNDVQIRLSGNYEIGDTWNIKKTDVSNIIDFNMASGTYQIDYSTTSPQIIDINDNMQLKYIGDDKFIII